MLAFQEHLVLKAFVFRLSKKQVCQNIDGKGDPRVGFLFFDRRKEKCLRRKTRLRRMRKKQ